MKLSKVRIMSYIGVVVAAMCVTGCDLCSSTTIAVVASPSHRNSAYVIENNCGATVDSARQVTITHGDQKPVKRWTEGVIEQGTVLRLGGQPDVDIHWTSDTSLTVRFHKEHAADHVFKAANAWEGVAVTLQEVHRPSPDERSVGSTPRRDSR
jgi:hypothetical protein